MKTTSKYSRCHLKPLLIILCVGLSLTWSGCNDEDPLPATTLERISTFRAYPGEEVTIYGTINTPISLTLNEKSIAYSSNSVPAGSISFVIEPEFESGNLSARASSIESLSGYFEVLEEAETINDELSQIEQVVALQDSETLVVSGGALLKITNEDGNYEAIGEGENISFAEVDEQGNIWYVANGNQLVRSQDAGVSWSTFYEQENVVIEEVGISTNRVALILKENDENYELKIFEVADAESQVISNFPPEVSLELSEIVYVDADNIFLFDSENSRLVLSDDLKNWITRSTGLESNGEKDQVLFGIRDIFNITASDEERRIRRSINAGKTWQSLFPRFPWEDEIFSHHFFTESKGLVITKKGAISRTGDGGESWKVNHIDFTEIVKVAFSDTDESVTLVVINASGENEIVKVRF